MWLIWTRDKSDASRIIKSQKLRSKTFAQNVCPQGERRMGEKSGDFISSKQMGHVLLSIWSAMELPKLNPNTHPYENLLTHNCNNTKHNITRWDSLQGSQRKHLASWIHRYLDIVFIVDAWGHMDVKERPSIAVFIVTNSLPSLLSEGENLIGESVFPDCSNLAEPASEQKKRKQLQLILVNAYHTGSCHLSTVKLPPGLGLHNSKGHMKQLHVSLCRWKVALLRI